MERICVYPGSFDPVTLGHEDVIRRAAKLFDRLIVAVMHNPQKTGCFPVQERMALLEKLTRDLPNVTIDCWDGLLVDYVRRRQAAVIVRGLRAMSDFEYEFQMALANKRMNPDAETVFLTTAAENMYLSSSLIKQIVSFGGHVEGLVPECIREEIEQRLSPREKRS